MATYEEIEDVVRYQVDQSLDTPMVNIDTELDRMGVASMEVDAKMAARIRRRAEAAYPRTSSSYDRSMGYRIRPSTTRERAERARERLDEDKASQAGYETQKASLAPAPMKADGPTLGYRFMRRFASPFMSNGAWLRYVGGYFAKREG